MSHMICYPVTHFNAYYWFKLSYSVTQVKLLRR